MASYLHVNRISFPLAVCLYASAAVLAALERACDYQHMVEPYLQATGAAGSILAVSSGMLLACAVAMPVVRRLPTGVHAIHHQKKHVILHV